MKKRKTAAAFALPHALTAALSCIILSLALSSCGALPRIIILHDPLSPEEHLDLGVAYERKGEYDAAMKQYREAAKKLPSAWVYMGNVSFEKGDIGAAQKYYKKAIDKDKNGPDAYNNLAWLYYTRKEKLDKAQMLAGKAVLLGANNSAKEAVYKDTLDKIKALEAANRIKVKALKDVSGKKDARTTDSE